MNPNFRKMLAVRATSTAALEQHQAREAAQSAWLASPEGIEAQRKGRAEMAEFIREANVLLDQAEGR